MKKAIATPQEKKVIKEIIKEPMGDDDIKEYLPNIQVMKYSKLKRCKTIDDLLPNDKSCAIILYENSPNSGHWVGVSKYIDKDKKPMIEVFDPYGNGDKDIVNWQTPQDNRNLGISSYYLSNLCHDCPYKVIHNDFKYQKSGGNINSCGRHCVHRLLMLLKNNLNLLDYNKYMKNMKKKSNLDFDEIVSALINKIS